MGFFRNNNRHYSLDEEAQWISSNVNKNKSTHDSSQSNCGTLKIKRSWNHLEKKQQIANKYQIEYWYHNHGIKTLKEIECQLTLNVAKMYFKSKSSIKMFSDKHNWREFVTNISSLNTFLKHVLHEGNNFSKVWDAKRMLNTENGKHEDLFKQRLTAQNELYSV